MRRVPFAIWRCLTKRWRTSHDFLTRLVSGMKCFEPYSIRPEEPSHPASVGSPFETALQCVCGRAHAARFTGRRICCKRRDTARKLAPTVHMLSALSSCPFGQLCRCTFQHSKMAKSEGTGTGCKQARGPPTCRPVCAWLPEIRLAKGLNAAASADLLTMRTNQARVEDG
jgi:hypothetical protein